MNRKRICLFGALTVLIAPCFLPVSAESGAHTSTRLARTAKALALMGGAEEIVFAVRDLSEAYQ